ncbi:hypothetical protein V1511DRAFT_492004 [Dipodascopsis uninucleata]
MPPVRKSKGYGESRRNSNLTDSLADRKRKIVFRPVLDNPYTRVLWPEVSQEDSKLFMDLLKGILEPIGAYFDYLKSDSESTGKGKKRKRPAKNATSDKSTNMKYPKPAILARLTLGLTNTTKLLEQQSAKWKSQGNEPKEEHSPSRKIDIVFICRADTNPALLVSHFPLLCTSSNPPVKLVQLPKGSMAQLAKWTGIEELAVIGLRSGSKATEVLDQMVNEKVREVVLPWKQMDYRPVNIKHILTTVPITAKKGSK